MSHTCDKNSSEKVLRVSHKQSKPTDKPCCSANKPIADFNYHEIDKHHKRKRLKTRKERSQVKGDWKETSRTKPYHCHCQMRKDKAYFQNSCQKKSKKIASFSSSVSVAQEPSIITENRLIGHHGLFNHEVKSIDIGRILSEQSKYEETSKRQVKEKSNSTSHLSASSHIPSLLLSDGLLAADADDVQFQKKATSSGKIDDNLQEAEWKHLQFNKQGSDITPGQKPQPLQDLSSGSFKSIQLSKHSSHRPEMTKTKNLNRVVPEKHTQSQMTPFAEKEIVKPSNINVKRDATPDADQLHKNKDHQTQSDGVNPNPIQLSSSSTADSVSIQHRRQDTEYVSQCVSAVAAGLCKCLNFPLLKKRNLVSEIRQSLLKSLQKRQGPLLQANLHEIQKYVRFGAHPTQTVRDWEPDVMKEDTLLCSDTSARIRSKHFGLESTPQLHQSLHETTEWLQSPVDKFFGPDVLPEFHFDFEPSGTPQCNFFMSSPTLCSGRKASPFEHWEKSLNKSKSNVPVLFDSFTSNFMDNTTEVEKSSFGPQYHYNIQPFFPYQAEFQDGYSAEVMHLTQDEHTFKTDRYSLAPSFPAQIHQPPQSNNFQPFSQYSQLSAFPALRSHHIDMMHYPPSHMLDRSPAPAPSSLLSPGQWSFPPMRLY